MEVNTRINYLIKSVLVRMQGSNAINMEDHLHKYCVSSFTIQVVTMGMNNFISSWNEHPIPGSPNLTMAAN